MKRSIQGYINMVKASWKTRHDVNSTINQLQYKLDCLIKSRAKDLRNARTDASKDAVRNRYDNDIKFYDYVLYVIKFQYYEIVSAL